MIKIINGTYGHRDGARIVPKTYKDAPFSLTPEKEADLVRKKVAEYVEQPKTVVEQKAAKPAEPKLDELKAIAETHGIDASKCRTKAEVNALIEAVEKAKDDAAIPPAGDGDEKNLADLSLEELQLIAFKNALDYSDYFTKEDFIALIEAGEVNNDDETPPDLKAAEPVI